MSDPNPGELSTEEIAAAIERSLKTLKKLGIDTRVFAPIIRLPDGDIVDGDTRHALDASWPAVEANLTPTQAEIVRFTMNFTRRLMKREQIVDGLSRIAELTGWTAQEISENLGIPSPTVYRYLPRRFKGERGRKPGKVPYYPGSVRREQVIKELEGELKEVKEAEQKLVDVIFSGEEQPKPKTPEETAASVYDRFPQAPDRFVRTALRRVHPTLPEEEIDKVLKEMRPRDETPRVERNIGFFCPVCQTWRPRDLMVRVVNELKKIDPELEGVVLIRMRKQPGWEN